MRRLGSLAFVVVLAASSMNCSSDRANSGNEILSSPNILAPSPSDRTATFVAAESKSAGKHGNGSSSLDLVMYADVNENDLPNWGDTVTFNVSTTETTEPHVDLTCSRNGDVVYGATTGYYASYPWPWTQFMTLSSTAWQSGAADCTAELYYFSGKNARVLKSISFIAGP